MVGRVLRLDALLLGGKADDHNFWLWMHRSNFLNEPFASRTVTVIFGIAICLMINSWANGMTLRMSVGMKHNGLQYLMRRGSLFFTALIGQTACSIDFVGRKVLRAFYSNKNFCCKRRFAGKSEESGI